MKILTFDFEDWFHLLDNEATASVAGWKNFPSRLGKGMHALLNMLDRHDQKATFFILGWVADNYPSLVKEISARGHHIGSHSYSHQLVYRQTPQEFRDDLAKSKDIIEGIIGRPIDSYRAPGFSIVSESLWAFEIIADLGFKLDSSVFPAARSHGGIVEFPYAEPCIGLLGSSDLRLFPLNSRQVFGKSFVYSGGGYFRLCPEFLLKYWFKRDNYVMTYFHPRDFDPDQPVAPGLGYFRYFKSYVGLSGALHKLEKLIRHHEFVALDDADRLVDWSKAKTVNLLNSGKHI
jgi:polysaccharide deacetylase family protein (PEP-CTERM system associated)